MSINNKFLLLCEDNDTNQIIDYYNINKNNIDLSFNYEDALRTFCFKNNFDLVKWIINENSLTDIFVDNLEPFKILCKNGNLEIYKWLYENYCQKDTIKKPGLHLLYSIRGKNLELTKYILEINEGKLEKNKVEILANLSPYSNDQFEFFFNLVDEIDGKDLVNCFRGAFVGENLTNLNKLVNKYNKTFENMNAELEIELINHLLDVSDIDIFLWFMEKKPYINYLKKENIMKLIFNDNLKIIQYFYNKDNHIFDKLTFEDLDLIHEKVFFDPFEYSYKIHMFLLEKFEYLEKKIVSGNHMFFKNNCRCQNFKLIDFLVKKYPKIYYAHIEDDEIIEWNIIKKLELKKERKIEKKETCPICMDKLSNVITFCNHQYCYDCINSVYSKKDIVNCPICRRNIEEFYKLI